jgi:PhnB protein
MSTLNPYLSFRNDAAEAMAFYQSVFGGELTSMTFEQGGMPVEEHEKNLVMHSQLETPSGFTLMGSDTPSHMDFVRGNDMTVSLSGTEADELRGYWDRLAVGADVTMPLETAPWGDSFGQLVDRFGTRWMMNISGAAA